MLWHLFRWTVRMSVLLFGSRNLILLIWDARTHACMHVSTHTRTRARARTHTHIHTHTYTHTHTHTHTHTYTRMHARIQNQRLILRTFIIINNTILIPEDSMQSYIKQLEKKIFLMVTRLKKIECQKRYTILLQAMIWDIFDQYLSILIVKVNSGCSFNVFGMLNIKTSYNIVIIFECSI